MRYLTPASADTDNGQYSCDCLPYRYRHHARRDYAFAKPTMTCSNVHELDQWKTKPLSIKGALIRMGLPLAVVAQTLQAVETAWVEKISRSGTPNCARQAVNMALLAIKKA
jgi:hypothetical protein